MTQRSPVKVATLECPKCKKKATVVMAGLLSVCARCLAIMKGDKHA